MKKLILMLGVVVVLISGCGWRSQETNTTAAPDFTLPNALGGNVSLDDYNGRNVLLFFHMAVG